MNKTIISLALINAIAAPISYAGAPAADPDQPRFARTVVSVGDSQRALTSDLTSATSIAQSPLLTTGSGKRVDRHTAARSFDTGYRIFSAATALLADFDGDGFAHRFSLSFDADTRAGYTATAYAVVLISFEGGPWNHFHTTEAFRLFGDSVDDKVDMISELDDGYPPGYYDFLIELYEVGTDAFVADFGPYQTEALFALPLEDLYSDDFYDYAHSYVGYSTDIYVGSYGGGGGSDLLFLAVTAIGIIGAAKPAASILRGAKWRDLRQPDRQRIHTG